MGAEGKRVPWSREELIVVCGLYFTLPFGQMHARNPRIIEIAQRLGRTPSSIAMKLVNFASLDPSVSWDAMTFVTGKGDVHEVPLLPHASVVSGTETPGTAAVRISGSLPRWGVDTLHLHFRDTRYTVATTDALFETQLAEDVKSATDAQRIHVDDASGIRLGDYVILERLGTNEEMCWVMDSEWITNVIWIRATIDHPAGSYVCGY